MRRRGRHASSAPPPITDLTAMGDALGAAGAPLTGDAPLDGVGAARPVPRRHRPLGRAARVPRVRRATRRSPAIVGRAAPAAERVWLYEDSVLVKEPGTVDRTAFHQDLAYFHVDGDQVCTVWVPLDPVDTGQRRGAVRARLAPRPHRVPTQPVRHHAVAPGHRGRGGARPHRRPGARAVRHPPGRRRRPPRPHHPRRAREPQRRSPRRRASPIRYAGDDAVFRIKPGAPQKAHHATLVEGAPLAEPACPMVWPVSPGGAAPRR